MNLGEPSYSSFGNLEGLWVLMLLDQGGRGALNALEQGAVLGGVAGHPQKWEVTVEKQCFRALELI